MKKSMNLQLFADEAAAPVIDAAPSAPAAQEAPKAEAAPETPNSTQNVTQGEEKPSASAKGKASSEASASDPEARRKEWEATRDKYRDLYESDQESLVTSRLKASKRAEKQASEATEKLRGMLDPLYSYYGIEQGNEDALSDAISRDNLFVERLAMEADMSPEKYREMMELKRYRSEHEKTEAMREREAREAKEQSEKFTSWAKAEAEIREKLDPDFDLIKEARNNPSFADLVYNKNVDVNSAYYATHAYALAEKAAKEAREGALKDIAANGSRPAENSIKAGGAAIVTDKPLSQLNKAERDALAKRMCGITR